MGRELRMVPANWEHPQETKYNPFTRCESTVFIPLYDSPYLEAITEWIKGHSLWVKGLHEDQQKYPDDETLYYAEAWGDAPTYESYRPDWKDSEMVWYQVYETVSEGTPVTPPFGTQEELVEYLVLNGDFWDQKRRADKNRIGSMPCGPWSREAAEKFVYGPGWAPSMVMVNGVLESGHEALAK